MRTSENSQRGFTLVELMVVVALGLIIMGMAIGGVPSMLKTARADSGLTELATALRFARESSISNRRNVQLTFGGNTITATRVEYCPATCTVATVGSFAGCTTAAGVCVSKTTALRTVTLENYAQFLLVTSPSLPDTPDAFGNATATAFGSNTPPMFTTDGSFINSQGDVLNGSLFISIPGDRTSARAITIFGPTGAMHLWRWNGKAWVEV